MFTKNLKTKETVKADHVESNFLFIKRYNVISDTYNWCSQHPSYLLILLTSIITHLNVSIYEGDYTWFYEAFENYPLIDYTRSRYFGWTSRNIIEMFLGFMVHNPCLWMALDVIVDFILCWCLENIFNRSHDKALSYMVALLLLCRPLIGLDDAGYIPVSLNYSWPITAGLYVLLNFTRIIRCEKVSIVNWLLVILATVFSANVEMMSAILFISCIIMLTLGSHKLDMTSRILVSICGLIALVEMINVFVCPGNSARIAVETEVYLPAFSTFTIIDKLYLGFMSTMQHYLYSWQPLFMIFCIILVIAVFIRTNSIGNRFLSCIPLITVCLCLCTGRLIHRTIPLLGRMFVCLNLRAGERGMAPMIIYVILIATITWSLIVIYRNNRIDVFLNILIAVLGFATRTALGFSASLFEPGVRTFMYLDLAIVLLILYAMMRLYGQLVTSKLYVMLGLVSGCALSNYVTSLITLE